MFNWLSKRLTRGYAEVPLFWVEFNLNKYKTDGVKNSCLVKIHPELQDDNHIQTELFKLIDYIRENYDMEKLSR